MNISDAIMLAVQYSLDKGINRTTLQKTLYFIDRSYKLGCEFQPHFYGPYSKIVDDQIERLVQTNLVKEIESDITPNNQYNYTVTNDSKQIIEILERKCSKEAKLIKELVIYINKKKLKASDISAIAKVQYIQDYLSEKKSNKPVKTIIRHMGWNIDDVMPIKICEGISHEINTILGKS